MKKYLWLVGLISLFALGQMVPLSQATAADDNRTIISGDGVQNLPCRILVPGSNDSFTVIPNLATTPEWAAGNAAIVKALLGGSSKYLTETTVNMDALAADLGLPPGVYVYRVTAGACTGAVTYFKLPPNLASRADLLPQYCIQ